MSKKLYAALLPVIAVIAFAIVPAAAQAIPHWYACEKVTAGTGAFSEGKCVTAGGTKEFEWIKIKEGTKAKPNAVAVTTKGTLTLVAIGNKITCKVKDKGFAWNPAGGGAGEDEITEFANTECTSEKPICAAGETLELTTGVPPTIWYSMLELVGAEIRDRIFAMAGGVETGIEVKIECNKAGTKTVQDTFTGTLKPKVGVNQAEFGAGSGELEDPAKNKAKVEGNDEVEGPAGQRGITAKNP